MEADKAREIIIKNINTLIAKLNQKENEIERDIAEILENENNQTVAQSLLKESQESLNKCGVFITGLNSLKQSYEKNGFFNTVKPFEDILRESPLQYLFSLAGESLDLIKANRLMQQEKSNKSNENDSGFKAINKNINLSLISEKIKEIYSILEEVQAHLLSKQEQFQNQIQVLAGYMENSPKHLANLEDLTEAKKTLELINVLLENIRLGPLNEEENSEETEIEELIKDTIRIMNGGREHGVVHHQTSSDSKVNKQTSKVRSSISIRRNWSDEDLSSNEGSEVEINHQTYNPNDNNEQPTPSPAGSEFSNRQSLFEVTSYEPIPDSYELQQAMQQSLLESAFTQTQLEEEVIRRSLEDQYKNESEQHNVELDEETMLAMALSMSLNHSEVDNFLNGHQNAVASATTNTSNQTQVTSELRQIEAANNEAGLKSPKQEDKGEHSCTSLAKR